MSWPAALEILQSQKLRNWMVLTLGFEREWVKPAAVSQYAYDCFDSEVRDSELSTLAKLTAATTLHPAETAHLMNQLCKSSGCTEEDALDSWRLARLLDLREQQLDWEDKVTRLEEIYAEFGFPRDMRYCTRYQVHKSDFHDPLKEMDRVIGKLQRRLCPSG